MVSSDHDDHLLPNCLNHQDLGSPWKAKLTIWSYIILLFAPKKSYCPLSNNLPSSPIFLYSQSQLVTVCFYFSVYPMLIVFNGVFIHLLESL